ncbi:MAG: NAD-dependent epimerase/dehydratase family protein [Myxococcales bacterium]|nr:NAD-dependent epimerase/dehydratase family protein [Myxococcales bacterium]
MKRALVTGASGFIGRHLVRALQADGWQVEALVRTTSNIADLEGCALVVGDLTEPETLRPAMAHVDAVFHLASLLKVPWRADFAPVNVEGTRAVAAACAAAARPPVLVVVSSMAATGPALEGRPRVESDPPAPVSRYGRVKRAAELAAAEFADRVPLTIVRPPMVFGEGDRGALPLFRGVVGGWHLVPTRAARRIGLVHAADLSVGLIAAARRGARLPGGDGASGAAGIYFIAAPETPTYAELGRQIAEAADAAVRVVHLPSPVTRVAATLGEWSARLRDRPSVLNVDKYREAVAGDWICDVSRARSELGWRPTAPLAVRIRQTIDGYRAAGWL